MDIAPASHDGTGFGLTAADKLELSDPIES